MKQLLATLALAFACTGLYAQEEQDFASRYMTLYADSANLECNTISPAMIDRMMLLGEDGHEGLSEVLASLKSIRIIVPNDTAAADSLYEKAVQLVKRTPQRYQPHVETVGKHIYMRKNDGYIVELILLAEDKAKGFTIVNLTGNMDADFLDKLLRL